jgi:predicted glycosyl hydrolase (DUF1957 family)
LALTFQVQMVGARAQLADVVRKEQAIFLQYPSQKQWALLPQAWEEQMLAQASTWHFCPTKSQEQYWLAVHDPKEKMLLQRDGMDR